MWERRNCSLRAISPFPIVVSMLLDNLLPFPSNLELSSANSFRLEESKIFRLGKSSSHNYVIKRSVSFADSIDQRYFPAKDI